MIRKLLAGQKSPVQARDEDESTDRGWRSVPRKLKLVGYNIRRLPPGTEPPPLEFSNDEIERMAILEHTRWNWFHYLRGWTVGPRKEAENRKHHCLVPWSAFYEGGAELSEDYKEYDREMVRLIPDLLAQAGYGAYRPDGEASV